MKISVAMATYNGARYLREQLKSFSTQSRLPDELIVCDDLSDDQSIEILTDFASKAGFEVKVYRNKTRLGLTKNFEKAISLCTGQLVFLSDQDDFWFDTKLEVMERIFNSNPSIMVAIHDQEIADAALKPIGRTLFQSYRAMGCDEKWLTTGCCTVFRAEFARLVIPIPDDLAQHDIWIHLISKTLGVRMAVPDILQLYRRHDTNASNQIGGTVENPSAANLLRKYGLRDATSGWESIIKTSKRMQQAIVEKNDLVKELNLEKQALALLEAEIGTRWCRKSTNRIDQAERSFARVRGI